MSEIHRVLFEPTTIGSIHVKNRYAMAPMAPFGMSTACLLYTSDAADE